MGKARILIYAELPQELLQSLAQHVRTFDAAHPGCDFKVVSNAPDMTMAELMDAVQVDPPLPFQFYERKRG